MDTDERLRLRAKAQALEAVMSIGKSGVTDGVVEEVVRQLEEHHLLKVRVLASARDEKSTQE
ncbi:MAG: YhbY family RNA-binding protein, partial [Halobacteriales archaeon]|nr:YhbY family RNA-binding protein [Halobacteriales archaeon]